MSGYNYRCSVAVSPVSLPLSAAELSALVAMQVNHREWRLRWKCFLVPGRAGGGVRASEMRAIRHCLWDNTNTGTCS